MVTAGAAALTATSGVLAAATGWTSPTGIAAFLTSLVGGGALIWSIYQARKNRNIDVDAAIKIAEALAKAEKKQENG